MRMPVRSLIMSLVVIASASACSSMSRSTAGQGMYGGSGTLTGVIALPDHSAQSCDDLGVRAHLAGQADNSVGKAAVRASRGRCSYSLTALPTDAAVVVEVKPTAISCPSGSTVSLTPAAAPISLKDHETRIQLSVACSAAGTGGTAESQPQG